jgi:hypothetical protein
MDIDIFFGDLVGLLSDALDSFRQTVPKIVKIVGDVVSGDAIVGFSIAFFAVYALTILTCYFLRSKKDAVFLNKALNLGRKNADIDNLFVSFLELSGVEHRNAIDPKDVTPEPNNPSRETKIRSKRVLKQAIETFLSVDASRHYIEGIRPSSGMLEAIDSGPWPNVIEHYNTLVRLSLVVTFFGIAYILYVGGTELRDIIASNESGEPLDLSKITDVVLGLVAAAGAKFWITAFGYGFANLMLIMGNWGEARRSKKVQRLSFLLDETFDSGEANRRILDSNDNLSADEKAKLQSILIENVEKISAMGQEVNDNLVEKLGNISLKTEAVSEVIIDRVNGAFSDLRNEGFSIPVQARVSEEIATLLDELVRQVAINTSRVDLLQTILENQISNQTLPKTATDDPTKRDLDTGA